MLKFEILENFFKKKCSKLDLECNINILEGYGKFAYFRIDRILKYSGTPYYMINAVCGLRTMGEFKPEEMLEASEQIKEICELVTLINKNCNGIKISVDITTEEPIKDSFYYGLVDFLEKF